ncbi:MAG: TonB C-terminal domain-containing protein [Desulfobacterales bacterium]|nr:MAG: TonB C-terminal domain-containing protein [Desulfobacterales bacterium]
MIEEKHAPGYLHQETGKPAFTLVFYFGLSIICHVVFLGALIVVPGPPPTSRLPGGVVNVSLVSLPSEGAPAGDGTPVVAQPKPEVEEPPKAAVPETPPPPEPQAQPAVKPEAVPRVPLKPRKTLTPKTSLKEKTYDRSKVIESAISRIRKKTAQANKQSVDEAIARLRQEVRETEARMPGGPGRADPAGGSGPGIPGGTGGGGGSLTSDIMQVYQAEIAYRIQKNWAFAPQLAGDGSELETVLAIKILSSGKIDEIWFDKKSGNSYLDESAYRALVKSDPLPPLPASFRRPFYEIGFKFGPKGLK